LTQVNRLRNFFVFVDCRQWARAKIPMPARRGGDARPYRRLMPSKRSTTAALAASLLVIASPGGGRAEGPAAAGDAGRGEALYVGTVLMANGGAPCLACHGVSGHGLSRAASFGPDLSATYASYGAETLDVALQEIPYPSMQPVYNGHALTAQERADVVAFLGQADGKVPSRLGAGFAAGVAGAMALFAAAFVWIGRRGSRRASGQGETP
jgi:mono/diheme cytochrome c family protein